MAKLLAYFDESERSGGVFCVAGYIFEVPQARKFAKEWTALFGNPGSHMVDLVARRKQFEGISEGEKDRLIREAVRIINRRAMAAVAVSCNVDEVRKLSPKFILGYGDAYPVCCHLAMNSLGNWLRDSGLTNKVHYFFENGHEFDGEAEKAIANAIRSTEMSESYRYAGATFIPKKDAVPLQAADLLAWEIAKFRDETVERQIRRMRGSLRALIENDPKRYSLAHITGLPLAKYMQEVHALGLMSDDEVDEFLRTRGRDVQGI